MFSVQPYITTLILDYQVTEAFVGSRPSKKNSWWRRWKQLLLAFFCCVATSCSFSKVARARQRGRQSNLGASSPHVSPLTRHPITYGCWLRQSQPRENHLIQLSAVKDIILTNLPAIIHGQALERAKGSSDLYPLSVRFVNISI